MFLPLCVQSPCHLSPQQYVLGAKSHQATTKCDSNEPLKYLGRLVYLTQRVSLLPYILLIYIIS